MVANWSELSKSILAPCLRGNREDAIEIIYTNNILMNDITQSNMLRDIYMGIISVLDIPDAKPSPIMVAREYPPLSNKIEFMREIASIPVTKYESVNAVPMLKGFAKKQFVSDVISDAKNVIPDVEDTDVFITSLIEELSRGHNDVNVPTTADRIIEDIIGGLTSYGETVSTGFSWLNFHLKGGLRPGRHIAVGGGEKSRKTTWVRNILKGVLRNKDLSPNQDVSVLFLAFENDRYITAMDFVAMLAMEYMFIKHPNQINAIFGDMRFHELFDAELIMDSISLGKLDRYPVEVQESINWGMNEFAKFNIEIKDTTREGGDLSTLDTIKRAVHFHDAVIRKPDQLMIIVTDYLTLVEVDKVHDERIAQNLVVNWLTRKVADLRACAITVAQFNRSNVYSRLSGDEVDVMGTHGSSQLERAVQNYMDVQKSSDTTIKVRMRRARRGAGGLAEEQVYYMHPSSGLILSSQPENWFKLGVTNG